ncbi:endoplasmic reticulum resident protein 27 [Mus pahari]|uniref:endoplasmic reticulum resident protein 27 n=1 Tax=Mus pahari TaxID=10093 RepID=UPI000A30A058|nr:endoplasmic reticulum resident protein 27 [Mus pahari]
MKITRSRCLILSFVLVCGLVPKVTADVEEATGGLSTIQEPIWLTDVPATLEFIAAAEVAIIGFFQDLEIPIVSVFRSMAQQFQDVSFGISNHSEVLTHFNVTSNSICLFRLVDNQQLRLDAEDIESLDAAKLSRFIHMNNLHWVTEYSPMIAAGLFNTMVQTHLLLMMKKASPEYEESMHRYREAAKLFQGQVSWEWPPPQGRQGWEDGSGMVSRLWEWVRMPRDYQSELDTPKLELQGAANSLRDHEAEGDSGKEEL